MSIRTERLLARPSSQHTPRRSSTNLKLVWVVSLFVAVPVIAFAQKDGPAAEAPKPTMADAQKFVQTSTSSANKALQLSRPTARPPLPDAVEEGSFRWIAKEDIKMSTKFLIAAIIFSLPVAESLLRYGQDPRRGGTSPGKKDNKALEALSAKSNSLLQQIGPEYVKMMEGLDEVDPDSPKESNLPLCSVLPAYAARETQQLSCYAPSADPSLVM